MVPVSLRLVINGRTLLQGYCLRASEEQFIKDLNVFSNLKFRASYGQTGNQAIGAYATRDYLTVANYPINGALASGFANLTWKDRPIRT